jgi:rubredoxin
MDDDSACPKCIVGRVQQSPKRGDFDEYKCPRCHLVFSVSGSDRPAIEGGASTSLVPDASGRMWLKPDGRPNLP